MATRKHVTSWIVLGEVIKVVWSGVKNGDDGEAFESPDFADCSVQVTGTFGTGGSATFEGSNDGTNYVALTDPQGNALTLTAAKLEAVSELAAKKRPRVTAGDAATDLTFTMIARKGK